VCQEFNIENEIIPKIASCFGGGMGNAGETCGAVTGAIMAIGLVRKQSTSIEDYLASAEVTRRFLRRFEDEMGAHECRELTGLDLTTEDGSEALMNSDVAMTVCFPAVETAFRIVMELLKEDH